MNLITIQAKTSGMKKGQSMSFALKQRKWKVKGQSISLSLYMKHIKITDRQIIEMSIHNLPA